MCASSLPDDKWAGTGACRPSFGSLPWEFVPEGWSLGPGHTRAEQLPSTCVVLCLYSFGDLQNEVIKVKTKGSGETAQRVRCFLQGHQGDTAPLSGSRRLRQDDYSSFSGSHPSEFWHVNFQVYEVAVKIIMNFFTHYPPPVCRNSPHLKCLFS